MSFDNSNLLWFLVVVAEAAILLPLYFYVRFGWHSKSEDILNGLDEKACKAYFDMFERRGDAKEGNQEYKTTLEKFTKLYKDEYGKGKLILPGILLGLVSLVAIALTVFSAAHILTASALPPSPASLIPLPPTAMAAIAGAYMWVLNDLISRAHCLDMGPSDVQWNTLRMIIAVPMGYALGYLDHSMAPLIAFSMGAFPFTTIFSIIQRVSFKLLKLEPTEDEKADDIVKLQSVDHDILERLAREDIRTVTQIAYCDPVQITMRSNLSFNFVTDCMNQALAWMYFHEGLDAIRPLGLRGAVEIKHFVDDFDDIPLSGEPSLDHNIAVAALPKIAAALNQDVSTVQFAFRQIAGYPFTEFLYSIWTAPQSMDMEEAAAAEPEVSQDIPLATHK